VSLVLDFKHMASPALIRRGGVNVIGLEAIRVSTGARWERLRESIYARMETLLSQKLGPTDFYLRIGPLAYLIVMPSSSAEDAALCCLKIAYDLHRSLLGRCGVEDLLLSRVTGENADTLDIQPLPAMEMAQLAIRSGLPDLLPAAHTAAAASAWCPDGPAPQPTASFGFEPIWDSQHGAITSYRIVTHRPDSLQWTAVLATREDFRAELGMLLDGLTHAARILGAALQAGGRYLMTVPVPHALLSSPTGRMDIAAACRALPAELRPFLILTIAGVPPGVPQSRMGELACAIRPFCRAVCIELPFGFHDHATYQNLGASGFALALPVLAAPAVARVEIAKLAAAAKRFGLRASVSGLRTLELAEHARESGIDFLSGAFLGGEVFVPQRMSKLTWDDILASAATA
jgi:hypothetical protein